jgi:hypothetical protein
VEETVTPTTEIVNKASNMNRNDADVGGDSVSRAMVTASEDSNSSGQGDSGSSDLGGGSASERNHFERGSIGSGGSDNEGKSGSSDNGDQEANEEDQDSNKPNEVRKKRRVMANRRSARESRDRRKRLLSDLYLSVATLMADNSELARSNQALRRELDRILQEIGLTATLRNSLLLNVSTQAILAGGGVMPNNATTISNLHSFRGSSTR